MESNSNDSGWPSSTDNKTTINPSFWHTGTSPVESIGEPSKTQTSTVCSSAGANEDEMFSSGLDNSGNSTFYSRSQNVLLQEQTPYLNSPAMTLASGRSVVANNRSCRNTFNTGIFFDSNQTANSQSSLWSTMNSNHPPASLATQPPFLTSWLATPASGSTPSTSPRVPNFSSGEFSGTEVNPNFAPGIGEDGCNPKLALTSKATVINSGYGPINTVNCSFRPYYSGIPVKGELSNMCSSRRSKNHAIARSSTPADKECSSCGSKDVPLWRKDASGHYICNWCGLHWKNNCNNIPTRHSSKQKQLIICANCHTTSTTLWRRNSKGEQTERPLSMKKDTIQTRNRKKNSKKKKPPTKSLGISPSQDFVVMDKTPQSLYGSLSARSQYSHHSVCNSTILPPTYLSGNSQHLLSSFAQKNALS
ncbi:Transcription factor GATA-5 [Trichoplax sp. H2]|nr:Transcription factor GATA-5 [Trichoplax sp. H2]|eukprot:RDD46873.1 Transcription factor GATA-5 [Trichoplax sp. H2]